MTSREKAAIILGYRGTPEKGTSQQSVERSSCIFCVNCVNKVSAIKSNTIRVYIENNGEWALCPNCGGFDSLFGNLHLTNPKPELETLLKASKEF